MNAEELIKNLEYTRKKYEGKKTDTFETNIVDMIDDCLSVIKDQKRLATIGKATELAFEIGKTSIYIKDDRQTVKVWPAPLYHITSTTELLEWAESEGKE